MPRWTDFETGQILSLSRVSSRRVSVVLLVALLCACGTSVDFEPAVPADLILTNAAVYTMNPVSPRADTVVIRDGLIVGVGDATVLLNQFAGPVRDLHGMMLLPGFHDAHAHPVSSGVQLFQCDLFEIATVEGILNKIKACQEADPGEHWLVGSGWNLGLFPEANPHRTLLDAIAPDRPVYLEGEDGHSSWVNSQALRVAGITADTPDPPLGIIERDADGSPSGTLRETAQSLVTAVTPNISDAQRLQGLKAAVRLANSFGITAIVDAAVGAAELKAYRRLEQQGGLTVRIVASMAVMPGASMARDLVPPDPASRGSGALVRTDAAKIYLDGVLEGETAALLEPYLGREGAAGRLQMSWERLAPLVAELDARGVQIHMHAIGDAAVRQGLDALEAARQINGVTDNRHHISHLQLVDAADIPRFGQLGVLANFQALWAYPDAYITDVNLPVLGQARVDRMYPIGSIARAGGIIVAGSDWNVTTLNPLPAIEVALTRRDPAGIIDLALNPGEAVSLDTMLAAYTRNGAYLMHQETQTGTIEPGKAADLVVLEDDLYALPPEDIDGVAVAMTLFQGKIVFERSAGSADLGP